MNEEKRKNIIDLSDARKRQKRAGASMGRNQYNGKGAQFGKSNKKPKEYLASILRWGQFILLLALTTYVLQQCGVL